MLDRRRLLRALIFTAPAITLLSRSAALADGGRGRRRGRGRGRTDDDERWLEHNDGHDAPPLDEILQRVVPRIDGRVIEIEFGYEHGRPVYEIKYIDRQGRIVELYVDAHSGAILKHEFD